MYYPTNGLVAFYRFDGDVLDSIGTYHLTEYHGSPYIGSVDFATGITNDAVEFLSDVSLGGLLGYATLENGTLSNDVFSGTKSWSFSVFFKMKDTEDYQILFSMPKLLFNGNFLIWFDNWDTSIRIRWIRGDLHDNQYFDKTINKTFDRWIHIAGTYDPSTHVHRCYLDGSYEGQFTSSYNIIDGSAIIGSWWHTVQPHYNGLIDNFLIYNRVLNDTEIYDHYYSCTSTYIPPIPPIDHSFKDKILKYNEHVLRDSSINHISICKTYDDYFKIGTGVKAGIGTIYGEPMDYYAWSTTDSSGNIYLYNIREYNDISVNGIVRLFPNGSIDTTFNVGLGPQTVVDWEKVIYDVIIDSSNKILVIGSFNTWNNYNKAVLVRLNQNGTYDSTFDASILDSYSFLETRMQIKQQNDGKYIITGYHIRLKGESANTSYTALRLNNNGSKNYGILQYSGYPIVFMPSKIDIDPSTQKIYLIDYRTSGLSDPSTCLRRYNTNGTFDSSFNIIGKVPVGTLNSIEFYNDKIYLFGNLHTWDGSTFTLPIIRINQDGTLDHSFNLDSSGYALGNVLNVIDTERVNDIFYIMGDFRTNDDILNRIISYDINGNKNNAFNSINDIDYLIGINNEGIPWIDNNPPLYSIAYSIDNRLYCSGEFQRYKKSSKDINKIIAFDTSGNNVTLSQIPPLIFDISINSAYESYSLPFNYPFYQCTGSINWGDNTCSYSTRYNLSDLSHTYTSPGIYTIILDGQFWSFVASDDARLIGIRSFGRREPAPNYIGNFRFDVRSSGIKFLPPNASLGLKYLHSTYKSADGIFYNIQITEIPENLFEGTDINTFNGTFSDCTKLTSIPQNLFYMTKNPSSISEIAYCFYNCTNLTGNAPDIWNHLTGVTSHDQCFHGCTGLSNYASIPADWK